MNEQQRQLLEEHIALFENDESDEQRAILLDVIKEIDPRGYQNLMKSQCAYEFHMILEAILNP
ncbi:hypothetical protein LLG96_00385 [bacterium]|nr:hypothetical protein [bacterium]